jgi:plastocyanin
MERDVRRWKVAFVVAGIVLAACQPDDRAPGRRTSHPSTTYSLFMGAPSPEGRHLGFTSFFPSSVTIHPGDSVELYNRGGFQAEHTVTFGADAAIPVVVDGAVNPRVADACAAPDARSACAVSGSWTRLPPYGGRGFWSTGLVYDFGRVEVTTTTDLAPGTYAFGCLIHPSMRGTLRVVAPGEPVDDPDEVHAEALRTSDAAVADVEAPRPPRLGRREVAAGWSSDDVVVDRFSPVRLEIRAGDVVTWVVSSLQDVTFDSSGGVARVSSGPLADGSTYRMRFAGPGVYRYHCTRHVGMTGLVVVRPRR